MDNVIKIASDASKLYFEPLVWLKNAIKKAFNRPSTKSSSKNKSPKNFSYLQGIVKDQNLVDDVLSGIKHYEGTSTEEIEITEQLFIFREAGKEYEKSLKEAVNSLKLIEINFEDASYIISLEKESMKKKFVKKPEHTSNYNQMLEFLIVESILLDLKELSSSISKKDKSPKPKNSSFKTT